ncbi:isochorismate synthase [Fodinibius sp. Rm-B-1B1-1]|uniref:isochorismate synthase n=1 Tax=Fodinibius alkaliphilus TaxID=3140241 RepID=UPI00315AB3E1
MTHKQFSEVAASLDSLAASNNFHNLQAFLSELFDNSDTQFASISFPIDTIDPLAFLEICWKDDAFQYYWEKPNDEFAIAASGALTTITANGPNRFEEVNHQFQAIRNKTAEYSEIEHPNSGFYLLGGFSFFDKLNSPNWDSFAPATFTLPEWIIIKDGKFSLVTFTVDLDTFDTANELNTYLSNQLTQLDQILEQETQKANKENGGSDINPSLPSNRFDHQKWVKSVSEAKELIREDIFEKIVLARHLSFPKNNNTTPTQVLNKLREQYINCYNFLLHQPSGKTFLGSTPERLVSARNKLLLTEALAGSIRRGTTATEDTLLEKQLSGNRKDQDEHSFVIKDIEERLEPFTNDLQRHASPDIKKLSNVQHLYTPIRARLNSDSNIFEVIEQLHPTPAVGGYPWTKAEPYIKELEHFERGMYAGPIGWINAKGDIEFAVSIRSALFNKDNVHLFAGCGIVEDSDPEAEWEETNLKLKPLLSALQYD